MTCYVLYRVTERRRKYYPVGIMYPEGGNSRVVNMAQIVSFTNLVFVVMAVLFFSLLRKINFLKCYTVELV